MTYHWSNKDKLEYDNQYLTDLYERYLIYLSNILNKFHNKNKDTKYWRIIIGPWLKFFIDIVFDRYETLKLKNINLSQNDKKDIKKYLYLRSNDFESFFKNCSKDEWNNNLIRLIQGLDPFENPNKQKFIKKKRKLSIKSLIKNLYIIFINPINRKINKNILIIDPYIQFKSLLNFTSRTGFIPYLTKSRDFKGSSDWAEFIENIYEFKFNSNFEKILNKLVLIYIPNIYTDNFIKFRNDILKEIKILPKIIFTASGYQSNEEFKLIAAETYTNNGKILISQHGGNMSLAKYNQTEKHQIMIANQLYSYGWRINGINNITPMPSMKLSTLGPIKPNKKGRIINVMGSFPRYFYCFFSMPLGPEYLDYLNLQKELENNLHKNVASNLFHRLDGDLHGWNAKKLLNEKGLKLCKSNTNLKNELQKCSICISSYNSTVALETLSANFPTILYWPDTLFEIREDALSYIKILEEVGIFHTSAISAGKHLNKIANNVEEWWKRKSVQAARKLFISKYALSDKNWIKYWAEELIKQSKFNLKSNT